MGTFALPMSWHSALNGLNGAQIATFHSAHFSPDLRELCQVLMLHFEKPPEQNAEHSGFFQTFLLVLSAAPQNTPIYQSDSDIVFVYTHTYI